MMLTLNSAKGGEMLEAMHGFIKEMPKISENNDKYEFTGEYITFEINGETHTVYRIRAKKIS